MTASWWPVSIGVTAALVAACAGAARTPTPATVAGVDAAAEVRTLSEAELLDPAVIGGVLRDTGFAVEVVDGKHILIESDGQREGRYLMTPHAEQRLLHITKMYVLRHLAEDGPRLLELSNEVNQGGIVKTYIDADGDLAIEAYLFVYGPMPGSVVATFARVFHARADDAAGAFAEFAEPGEAEAEAGAGLP
jgi:hypothetical protein